MLSDSEREKIQVQLDHYPQKQPVVPEALKTVQRSRGWVSGEAVRDIAEFLSLTVDEVVAVATFYNLIYRKPVGRHVILLCDSVSCWITGYKDLYEHLRSRLGVEMGQTTSDGRFTLLSAPCLGACDQAPVMMIDEDLHGKLDADRIDRILSQYP
jgi:NADH-quinone oxidoreductase subunit E